MPDRLRTFFNRSIGSAAASDKAEKSSTTFLRESAAKRLCTVPARHEPSTVAPIDAAKQKLNASTSLPELAYCATNGDSFIYHGIARTVQHREGIHELWNAGKHLSNVTQGTEHYSGYRRVSSAHKAREAPNK